jgi:hypothetical protein
MDEKFIVMFDPELVLPAEEFVSDISFWGRLASWIEDTRPAMSAATYIHFNEMVAKVGSDPSVLMNAIPLSEFWAVVSKLSSRINHPSTSARVVASDSIARSYRPHFGASGNRKLLIRDLEQVDADSTAIIATDRKCWSNSDSIEVYQDDHKSVYLLTSPHGVNLDAWRDKFYSEDVSFKLLKTISPRAFPALSFSESAWNKLSGLVGSEVENAENIFKHLQVLNDRAQSIWSTYVNNADRQAALGSEGVEASPESPNTHRSKSAMDARKFVFGQETVLCEWHTKLRRNVNRIYFAVTENGVYVGAIVAHLPTA